MRYTCTIKKHFDLQKFIYQYNNKWLDFKKSKLNISEKEIKDKILERDSARDNKNYELADKIRKELLDKGVSIEDKNGKTFWKYK